MNSRQLEIFCAIMLRGTMTEAAEVLHISQPALSQALGHMECQIGFKLFGRSKGRLVPSPEAQKLFSDAKTLLDDLRKFERQAKSLQSFQETTRIAASYGPSLSLVPFAIHAFKKKFPKAKVVVDVESADAALQRVQNGEADIGVTLRSAPSPLLDIDVIAHTHLVCVMKESDPLAQADHVSARDLRGRRIITYPSSTNVGTLVAKALFHECENVEISMTVLTAFVAFGFILCGEEIAIIDSLAAPWANTNGLTTRALHPTAPVPISIATKTSSPDFSHRAAIEQAIREAVTQTTIID